jgi:hypothetical protein
MFMTARSQAQNSADAGALAGAVALVFNDFDDRSPSGPAVTSAISAATGNTVMHGLVSVTAADVDFPPAPGGANNRIRVTVRRTESRGNAVPTFIGPLLGVDTADIMATATAHAAPADAATCVMPFTIPDKWRERQTGEWDPEDEFNMLDGSGNPLPNPDVYIAGPRGTGYTYSDVGTMLRLKANNDNKTAPSFYNPWSIGGQTGADEYSENIFVCNPEIVRVGQFMLPEPGNMVGPTGQGVRDLIAQDPDAYWDEGCDCVKGSNVKQSPRIATIPLYDPIYYELNKQNSRNASLRIANILGFFIEGMGGGEVWGRITPITGLASGDPNAEPGAFAMVIQLIE